MFFGCCGKSKDKDKRDKQAVSNETVPIFKYVVAGMRCQDFIAKHFNVPSDEVSIFDPRTFQIDYNGTPVKIQFMPYLQKEFGLISSHCVSRGMRVIIFPIDLTDKNALGPIQKSLDFIRRVCFYSTQIVIAGFNAEALSEGDDFIQTVTAYRDTQNRGHPGEQPVFFYQFNMETGVGIQQVMDDTLTTIMTESVAASPNPQ